MRCSGDRLYARPGVVRLPWNDPVLVKRAMDSGARTRMFPFAQSTQIVAVASDMGMMMRQANAFLATAR